MKKTRLQKRERNKDGDGSVEDNVAIHTAEGGISSRRQNSTIPEMFIVPV